ncbi:hypothetical protein ACJIZ3_015232 [Penstemon smallii]|uniref:EF-hand domain-containing protein n=1 Tax=Penstemon smallii TaxID=265156 RepID=A0ABD3RLZ1_9LAMI
MENRAILKEWFDRVDSERTGNITATQLKSAFAVGNLQFPVSVVQQMIRMYDFDRNGTMSFEEFVELNKFLLKVQQEFAVLERGRGFLVPDEVYEALVKIGFSLDSPAFYTVCESFDQTKSGKLRLDDFISLCIFVQSSRFANQLIRTYSIHLIQARGNYPYITGNSYANGWGRQPIVIYLLSKLEPVKVLIIMRMGDASS